MSSFPGNGIASNSVTNYNGGYFNLFWSGRKGYFTMFYIPRSYLVLCHLIFHFCPAFRYCVGPLFQLSRLSTFSVGQYVVVHYCFCIDQWFSASLPDWELELKAGSFGSKSVCLNTKWFYMFLSIKQII